MESILINPLSSHYNNNIKEGMNNGYTVVCSQRPFPCVKEWTQQSLSNGIYYGYGNKDHYSKIWNDLACKQIKLIINEEIEAIVKLECEENNADYHTIINQYGITSIASDLGYMYIEEVSSYE
ncbi:hypothetical protein [Aquibacillus saliphilus]|uniref:hypothetical protein n=1 Tax=Aquibacillus saliphilus TaxID=1909422 RepID=UPI001CEFCD93|nr:hypothetical protein [Aquibacillus saliphilus]